MQFPIIYTSTQMMDLINQIGFLPLLDSGIPGFAAQDIVAPECRYYTDPDEGFVWPLWQWKGEIVKETGCLYGKIFNRKAGFVSRQWIADLCNYRRSKYPYPANDTIEVGLYWTPSSDSQPGLHASYSIRMADFSAPRCAASSTRTLPVLKWQPTS